MIVSNRSTLLGKCARIQTPSFQCVVSTAKEGIFKKISTMIAEGGPVDLPNQLHPCGKLIYTDALSTKERYSFHDVVTKILNEAGENEILLGDAIQTMIIDMKERGIIEEGINIAERTYWRHENI